MKRIILFVIHIYQRLFSPDHSWMGIFFPYGCCRYYPTCSSYMRDAICRYGPRSGVMRGLRRLVRCHPWRSGGIDEA